MSECSDLFLSTSPKNFNRNESEYSALSMLRTSQPYYGKTFLLVMDEISAFENNKLSFAKYFNENYRTFDVCFFKIQGGVFSLDIKNKCGTDDLDAFLEYEAHKLQTENNYVFYKGNRDAKLYHGGNIDLNFCNTSESLESICKKNKLLMSIDKLEHAFKNYKNDVEDGRTFIRDNKIVNTTKEQMLRNDLLCYLTLCTNLIAVHELCTDLKNDEESVDIALMDSDRRIAMIEVKFFIEKGFFVDPNKEMYSTTRFTDGYKQLDKYCQHLKKDDRELHSAYLYMFYASKSSHEEIEAIGQKKLDSLKLNGEISSEFNSSFKSTFCHRLVD